MKKIFFLFAFWVGFSMLLNAQRSVIQWPMSENILPKGESFCYMLPKSAFKVDVTVTRVTESKGYFSDYAEKLLGLKNSISTSKTYFELKEVAVEAVNLPDSNYFYVVEPTAKQLKQGLADVWSPAMNQSRIYEDKYVSSDVVIPEFFKNYSDIAYVEKEDSYVETKIVDGVVVQVPVNQTKIVTKSLDKQAQEAADFIVKIRKDRYELLAGVQEVAYPRETIEYMVNELNALENNYLALFNGLKLEEVQHYILIVSPQADEMVVPLFSIDRLQGFVKAENNMKADYALQLEPQSDFPQLDSLNALKKRTSNSNEGYRIRQAVPSYVSLMEDGKSVKTFGLFPIYQYGNVIALPKTDEVDITRLGGFTY